MFYQVYAPHPALSHWINNIMINEARLGDPIHLPFPPLPEQCLYFYPHDPIHAFYDQQKPVQNPASIIVGPQTGKVTINPGKRHLVVKIGFQPGGLYRLLRMPMHEFSTCTAYDSTDLLGKELNVINEQLCHARSYPQMIQVIEQWLFSKMKGVKETMPVDQLFRTIILRGGLMPVDEMSKYIFVSNRQLERQFRERIGLSPKFFSRLVRFARAWTLKEHHQHLNWTNIAHECGYFDQMHMIRDFKEFAGVNPTVIEQSLQSSAFRFNNRLFC